VYLLLTLLVLVFVENALLSAALSLFRFLSFAQYFLTGCLLTPRCVVAPTLLTLSLSLSLSLSANQFSAFTTLAIARSFQSSVLAGVAFDFDSN
jgi:hypothetical protein